MGKTMEEWLRFSVCYWHTFRGLGEKFISDQVEIDSRGIPLLKVSYK